jgi:methylamine dehydrogenase accessory protein MauD
VDSDWFFASYILLWALVLGSFVMWLAVLRQIGILHNRWGPRGGLMTEDGPGVGEAVPRFDVVSVEGSELRFPGDGLLNLAVLTNPSCSACEELAPALGTLLRDPPEGVTPMVLVTDGGADAARRLARDHKIDVRRVASAPTAAGLLNAASTPLALLIDGGGRLLNKGIVNSLEQIEVLVAQARSAGTEDDLRFEETTPEGEIRHVVQVGLALGGEPEEVLQNETPERDR